MASIVPITTPIREDQFDSLYETSSLASITPPDSAASRRSWLSNLSTSTGSHRSSFSSASDGGHFSSPKPHKANQAAWEAMRRLRRESGGRVGLEHFRLLRRVGSGDIGSVYLCQIRNPAVGSPHCFYAMKVVDREALAARKKLVRAEMEKEILCTLDHPFLPTLYADFDASHFSCLVMEFCPGGDLYSSRLKLPSRRFPVSSAKFYTAETLLALEYLHMMGIVYRDLKPENVLVREDGHIMLSDFDLSLKCDVVPKLLKEKHPSPCTHHHRKHHPSPTNIITTCAGGPIQPVLSSCFSLRRHLSLRRSSSPLTTTITEHVDGRTQNNVTVNYDSDCDVDNYSSNSNSSSNNNNNNKYYCRSSSAGRFVDRREVVVEPIEARSRSFVGTHEYLAPEVISGQGHGSAVDWWTFGVFLYEMVYGTTPFKGQNNEETLRNILKQPLRFPTHDGGLSPKEQAEMETAKDLIRRLLVKNPKKRIGSVNGAAEIKRHEFFDGVNWALIRSVRPPVVPSEEAHGKKVSMMMKKSGGGGSSGGGARNTRPPALMEVPRVLSKKERDQPYQIPSQHHHHTHHFDFF